ncbi:MAG: fimbrial protein [Cyanothece sp. SIO1E1]|nr:fimbrial protein [Cyanothece sp. SIO1E1]
MNTTTEARNAAKGVLREAIAIHGGNTNHEAVVAAIEKLTQLNPTATPARSEALLDSQWLLMSAPNFPDGRQQANGKYVYTLGRLAFNMFQPTHLQVVIDRVLQPVVPTGNGQQRTHDIITEFTTVNENIPTLQGIVYNFGVCEPADDDALQVQFTGGALAPKDTHNLEAWKAIFGDQSKPAKKSLKEKLSSAFLGIMFGLVPPQGMEPDTGQISFKMRRSPKGKLKLLYLDEELRITQGERGTVLVCERQ